MTGERPDQADNQSMSFAELSEQVDEHDPNSDGWIQDAVQELNADPDLRSLYREALLHGNQELLRTKTRKQQTILKEILLGESLPFSVAHITDGSR